MVKSVPKFLSALTLLLIACTTSAIRAAIINVNEVMANEPASDVNLEWIELYIDGASTNLGFYEVRIGATTLTLAGTAASGDYLLICRDTTAVKGRWSVPAEQTRVRYFQRSFSLNNSGGTVEVGLPGNTLSSLTWTAVGADGVSWERVDLTSAVIAQSADTLGGTPGFVNSQTLLTHDLRLQQVLAIPDSGRTLLDLTIDNLSKGTFSGGVVRVYAADSLNPAVNGNELFSQSIPSIDSGFASIARLILPSISSPYAFVAVQLEADDRVRNNRRALVIPGAEFPPFRLNELLADPAPPQFSEWIELKNVSSVPLSLSGWKIGDVGSLNALPSTSLTVPAGGYVLLVQDSLSFKAANPAVTAPLVQPAGWNQLGNAGDLVRLVDPYGFEADRFSWTCALGGNLTHARDEDALTTIWGVSESGNGTPGTKNVVRLTTKSDSISLVLDPPFLVQGSAIHGEVNIRLSPPAAREYSLRLFDLSGRELVTFLDHATSYRPSYTWDGFLHGHPVEPGEYILLLEAHGVESIRKVLVVVPQ